MKRDKIDSTLTLRRNQTMQRKPSINPSMCQPSNMITTDVSNQSEEEKGSSNQTAVESEGELQLPKLGDRKSRALPDSRVTVLDQ
jgi:hypothetical protein